MFVSRRRWILKTCGTTTPLRCVRAVLALARDVAGHDRVHNVFYSRREFARPAAQLQPHDNFDSEVCMSLVILLKLWEPLNSVWRDLLLDKHRQIPNKKIPAIAFLLNLSRDPALLV